MRDWATERLVKWQCKRSQGVLKSSCMTGYARQHQCHWPKSSCWNYLDVCGRDICIHLWLGENWWQLGWCHHAQPRIRTFGQSRDNVFMRLAAVQPSACIGELSRLKKRVEIFETCWRIGCIWCIRVDSLNNLNLFHQGNPTLKCFFHRCSACVWVFGVFYRGLGFATGCLWPHGKAGQGSNEMPNDAPGGGRAGS